MISSEEHYILSYYRASELAGSLLMGRMAFHTTIDELRAPLTHHCAEEAEHAWLWTKTIKDLGLTPLKVTTTYQTELGKEFGMPTSIIEVLCLTQVFEKTVLKHFAKHLQTPHTHERIKQTLKKMLDDEVGHIGWIRKKLDEYSKKNGAAEVDALMSRIEEIDIKIYQKLIAIPEYKHFFGY